MKKWIPWLAGLLTVQIILAVALNMGEARYHAFQPEQRLADFDPAQVEQVRIEAPDKNLLLEKQAGQWRLPGLDNFPADRKKVETLLDTLAGLKKGWPVATSRSAARRFRVDDEAFERRITLYRGDDQLAQIYFGTSPGLRKVHARADGEDEITRVPFSLFKAGADNDDWIDRQLLKLQEEEITAVKLPAFSLQRQDGAWRLTDLAPDERMADGKAGELIGKLAGLSLTAVFAQDDKPELEEKTPPITITVTLKNGDTLDYRFSRLKSGSYLLQRSDQPMRFELAEWQLVPIRDAQRAQLVEKVEQEKTTDDTTNAAAPPAEG